MFRCSQRTVASWAAAAASTLAVSIGAAPPALAASSPLVTSHPDLIAAQAISPKAVLACFDQILAAPNFTDASFFLQGYTESRKTGAASGLTISTETAAGGGFCVVVAFKGPGDARSYSRLVVTANAVSSSVPGGGGATNVQSSVSLLGSVIPNPAGFTLRPELIAATPAASAATVTYTFTEPLSTAAGAFGFYTAGDSVFHAGTITSFVPGNTVTVSFSGADAALFGQATRFVAREGAVADALGLTNPTGTIGVGGGATKLLDLAATTGAAAGSLTYHFDFPTAIPNTAAICSPKFALYDASGMRYHAGTGVLSGGGTSVTLTFTADAAGGDPAQITLATVAAGALADTNCAGASLNSDGAAAESGVGAIAGSTSGPDLQSFQINSGTGIVSFVFDAPVAVASIGAFHIVDKSAVLTAPPNQGATGLLSSPPPQFTISPSSTVNVNFSAPTSLLNLGILPGPPDLSAVRNAVGVTIDEGAVADTTTAVGNPLASLGLVAATTGATGPTTPPAPTTPTVPPGFTTLPTVKPPVLKPCKRTLTIHLRNSVSSKLLTAKVTVNGKSVKVAKNLTVTINFGKYLGVKSIVVRIKGRLRNHGSIATTKTYKNKC